MRQRGFMLGVLALAGCSALINPDPTRLGEDEDAGPGASSDAGPMDRDAGSVDAGPADAGPPVSCTGTESACRGDELVTCTDGVEEVRDCQAEGGFCASTICRPWRCTPGARTCSDDLAAVVVCDARGRNDSEVACTAGACDPSTGRCVGIDPAVCAGLPELAPGDAVATDLCARPDESTFIEMADCDPRLPASAGDQIYALHIERAGRYRIEVEDDDLLDDIDTVVYLRQQCDQARSQLACSDDTACTGGGFPFPDDDCSDGFDLGLSRIELLLEPGTYYVVADAFVYDMGMSGTSECGSVEVRVTALE